MKFPASSSLPSTEGFTPSLRSFNTHAQGCQYCHDPYMVHLTGAQLCDVGHGLAIKATEALYAQARVFPGGAIDVTFPEGWKPVEGLIKSITHQLQGMACNRIDENLRMARTARSASTRRIEVAKERGQIIYVTPHATPPEARGSLFARDISKRGAVEAVSPPVRPRSQHNRRAHHDPIRSSSFDLTATAHEQPTRQYRDYSDHQKHGHHSGPHPNSHPQREHGSSREHGSPKSGRAVTFDPDVQFRFF